MNEKTFLYEIGRSLAADEFGLRVVVDILIDALAALLGAGDALVVVVDTVVGAIVVVVDVVVGVSVVVVVGSVVVVSASVVVDASVVLDAAVLASGVGAIVVDVTDAVLPII